MSEKLENTILRIRSLVDRYPEQQWTEWLAGSVSGRVSYFKTGKIRQIAYTAARRRSVVEAEKLRHKEPS